MYSRCAPEKRLASVAVSREVTVAPAIPQPRPKATSSTAISPPPVGDSTIVALKIISCILRASEQLGREKIAKILAGSKETSVEPFRALTTYGILAEYPIRSIVGLIDFLIGEGYIDGGEGFRPIIRVTPKGRQFLKDRVPIIIPGA